MGLAPSLGGGAGLGLAEAVELRLLAGGLVRVDDAPRCGLVQLLDGVLDLGQELIARTLGGHLFDFFDLLLDGLEGRAVATAPLHRLAKAFLGAARMRHEWTLCKQISQY